MTDTTTVAPASEPGRRKAVRTSASKLRDGVMKRGRTWSYVIRVPDSATGVSRPRWVGGFATEEEAKAARDEARVRSRRGEYVNRSTLTVADYLAGWVDPHAAAVKPKTLAGYRHDIDHYIVPRMGRMRPQALRPTVISKLYRDLAEHGGHDDGPLSAWTVAHIHRTLRKALADAVHVEQLLATNPAERSKRPRDRGREPTRVWTTGQLDAFLTAAQAHRPYAFYRSRLTPAPVAVNCSTSAGRQSIWTRPRSPSADQPPSYGASVSKEPPRAAGPGSSASTARPSLSCASISVAKTKNGWLPVLPGSIAAVWSSPAGGTSRSIPTP